MYPENPEGAWVIVGSLSIIYAIYIFIQTCRKWGHNRFKMVINYQHTHTGWTGRPHGVAAKLWCMIYCVEQPRQNWLNTEGQHNWLPVSLEGLFWNCASKFDADFFSRLVRSSWSASFPAWNRSGSTRSETSLQRSRWRHASICRYNGTRLSRILSKFPTGTEHPSSKVSLTIKFRLLVSSPFHGNIVILPFDIVTSTKFAENISFFFFDAYPWESLAKFCR